METKESPVRGEKENYPKKHRNREEVDCGRGQISMTITFRDIWRSGQIAADAPQVEMADLIPSSCDRKGVHYFHYCSMQPPPPPSNIPPSSVVVTLDVVLLRVKLKLQFACEPAGLGKRGKAEL